MYVEETRLLTACVFTRQELFLFDLPWESAGSRSRGLVHGVHTEMHAGQQC